MASIAVIADERQTTDVQQRLKGHRNTLAATRSELDQIEAEIDALLLAQGLGQKVDARRLEIAERKWDELTRAVRREQAIITNFEVQLRTWHAEARQRQYGADLAVMAEAAERAPAVEAAWRESTEHLMSITAELLDVQSTYDERGPRVEQYRHDHGLPGYGLRQPVATPIIPGRYFRRSQVGARLEQWIREAIATRGFGKTQVS